MEPIRISDSNLTALLAWIAAWAKLDAEPFLLRQAAIADALDDRRQLVEVLQECSPEAPWDWPAYKALNGARRFHADARMDMVNHLADKLMKSHRARYRWGQIDTLRHLRPFWQLRAAYIEPGWKTCLEEDCTQTYLEDDPTWETRCAPWMCPNFLCCCNVITLSRIEMQRYIQNGCAPGDEAAAELLRKVLERDML